HDYKILRRIERLPRSEELVGKARAQPIGTRTGVALQQQHAVDDLACGVAPCGAEGAVVLLQLGQCLAAAKHIIPDHEVALVIIWPPGLRTDIGSHLVGPLACVPFWAQSRTRFRKASVFAVADFERALGNNVKPCAPPG